MLNFHNMAEISFYCIKRYNLVLYKSSMSSDMENTVIKLFIDAMELSGVSSPNKISNGNGHKTTQTT